jgi:nucleoside-diphosphate-sugar epimerase
LNNILIIGVNGFTGSHLAKSLGVDYSIDGIGTREYPIDGISFKYINISNLKKEDIENVTYIIFCHARSEVLYTQNIFHESISTANKILNLAMIDSKKLRGVVYFSSVAIYRGYKGGSVDEFSPPMFDSDDLYAQVKILEEKNIIEFSIAKNINYLILRPSAIVGHGFHGNLISKIYTALMSNQDLYLNNQSIQFNALVGVSSVINIVKNFILGDSILKNKIFILSTKDSLSLNLLVDKMKILSKSKSKIVWGTSILRGPHLFTYKNIEFKNKYLSTIDDSLYDLFIK